MSRENTSPQAASIAAAASATAAAGRAVTSPGYLHINDPESGQRLNYAPGETLPEWVAEALADAGRVSYDPKTRVWTVADAPTADKVQAGK
ncbi:hypothetical protein ACGFI9_31895 [Micromonospora sp. NPDC048930]|uniref:hypothetical protein n=1 Tax=Micromonospora sp. NPDC048930 TaxID=3364261 RepID=UPI00371B820A